MKVVYYEGDSNSDGWHDSNYYKPVFRIDWLINPDFMQGNR